MAKKEKKEAAVKGRRYVGTAESAGYVLFDMSTKIPISPNAEWTDRILNIDKGVQAALGPIGTIWDIVNDLFVAAWVEKTRTRFGKFRPYLVLYPLYGLPVVLLVYLLPYFFWGTDSTFLPKIVAWFAMGLFNELTGTISGIARTGMMVNLTPDADERLSLITKAKFLDMFGSDLPKQIFDIVRDVISRNTVKTALEVNMNMRSMFLWFGFVTTLIAGIMSLYFVLVCRERVFGTEAMKEKPPTVKESFVALRKNRPLLMLTIADVLGGFTLKGQKDTYIRSVLNFANFGVISGIPGSPVSYISFAYIGKLRQRFSSKALWIFGDYLNFPMNIIIYFFGMRRVKNPVKLKQGVTRNFMDLWPMLAIYAVQNTIDMTWYGTRKVIPNEIRNECIDYGEWKSGIRSEAMTGVLRQFPYKITNMLGNTMTSAVMKLIGFKTGENYLNQSEKTQIGIFAMATLIPQLMGLVNLVPKLMFNINQKDRERMYAELAERRAAAAAMAQGIHVEPAEEAG